MENRMIIENITEEIDDWFDYEEEKADYEANWADLMYGDDRF